MLAYLNIAFGIIIVLLAYLIGRHKMLEVLAGYEPDKISDKEGLAKWVGANLLLMGLAGIFSGIVALLFEQAARGAFWSFFVVIALICARIVMGNRRYQTS